MPKLLDTFKLYHNLFKRNCLTDIDGKNFFDSLENQYVPLFLKNHIPNFNFQEYEKFFIFCRSIGYIYQLDNIILYEDQIKEINNIGLDFFLYEIDFFSTEKTKQLDTKPNLDDNNTTFLSKVYKNYLDTFNNDTDVYSVTLDSINKFVKRNKLTNVSVKYIYHNFNQNFSKKYDFEIVCLNICLSAHVNLINKFYTKDQKEKSLKNNLLAPFWRYEPYRHLLASYLATREDAKLSWHFSGDFEILKRNLWFEIKNKKLYNILEKGCKILDNDFFALDTVVEKKKTKLDGLKDRWKFPHGYDGYVIQNTLEDFYEESFCILVGESTFAQHIGTLSEKILIPIKCKNPFILAASPHSLKYLKKLGFKTFDKWWDESYDNEEDHEKRLIAILDLIDWILSLSYNQKKQLYLEMQDVINHNYRLIDNSKVFETEIKKW